MAAAAARESVDVPVALLGYGTVGAAVNRLLTEQADDIERTACPIVEARNANAAQQAVEAAGRASWLACAVMPLARGDVPRARSSPP